MSYVLYISLKKQTDAWHKKCRYAADLVEPSQYRNITGMCSKYTQTATYAMAGSQSKTVKTLWSIIVPCPG